jgi:hypothetical protein
MRWWKTFREDYDRPGFLTGIERFGTGFVHDVGRTWQLLCVEDGPGIRELKLTDEIGRMLARQFRVDVDEAIKRLQCMAEVGLLDISERQGCKVVSSKELKRRRDEWSKRKSRENLKRPAGETPELRRSRSGETPEQSQSQSQSQSQKQRQSHRTERNELTITGHHDMTAGNDRPCSLVTSTPWEYTGIDPKKIPKRFQNGFATVFQTEYERFRQNSHDNGECFCYRDEFLGQVREACQRAAVEYPKAILARQIELEKTA